MIIDRKILNRLNEIGIALSKERDVYVLMEKILLYAKELTHADGGTMYRVTSEKTLQFVISFSESLNFHVGGTSNVSVPFSDLPLFLEDGTFNDSLIVTYAVNHKKTVHIKDAYHAKGFDFSGTRKFDAKTGYRTRSVLTVPIKNHEDEVIAVLQLINPKNNASFSEEDEQLAESLASQAGVALTNQLLILDLRNLFESFIRVIAEAIDEKSSSISNHGKRVPIVTLLLAKAVSAWQEGPLKDVHFTNEDLYELEVAAFLHDCGKITTPVHLIEKQTKLETIFDRIELIHTRYIAMNEQAEKKLLEKKLQLFEMHFPKEFASLKETFAIYENELQEKLHQFNEDRAFIQRCNESREQINAASIQRLEHLANLSYSANMPLITSNELENLKVTKGNLTEKEREIIKYHVVMTYRMLSQLKFPKYLRNVAEIASSHHERVDGKGYPRGLKKEQMSIQARILTVADVFEALSAPDRPYKEALPLSQVLQIMQQLVDEGNLDPDVYEVFTKEKVYLPYARQYLAPEQIDV